jgi:hypothetical protein
LFTLFVDANIHKPELREGMADAKKAGEVNKSEEIREVARAMKAKGEKPRPVVIIAALKKRGIDVSSPQVSIVLKRMGMRPARRGKAAGARASAKATGRSARAAVAGDGVISIDDLLAAKKVASQLGGTDRALAALNALKRFES